MPLKTQRSEVTCPVLAQPLDGACAVLFSWWYVTPSCDGHLCQLESSKGCPDMWLNIISELVDWLQQKIPQKRWTSSSLLRIRIEGKGRWRLKSLCPADWAGTLIFCSHHSWILRPSDPDCIYNIGCPGLQLRGSRSQPPEVYEAALILYIGSLFLENSDTLTKLFL